MAINLNATNTPALDEIRRKLEDAMATDTLQDRLSDMSDDDVLETVRAVDYDDRIEDADDEDAWNMYLEGYHKGSAMDLISAIMAEGITRQAWRDARYVRFGECGGIELAESMADLVDYDNLAWQVMRADRYECAAMPADARDALDDYEQEKSQVEAAAEDYANELAAGRVPLLALAEFNELFKKAADRYDNADDIRRYGLTI